MIRLLQLSIFAIASVVVYASVYGLATLFAAVAIPVIAAGIALELGKYVSMSYAYQHWGMMRAAERALMLLFLSVTMIFTSVGVFSYLGQGYQTSYLALDTNRAKAVELQTQETELTARIAAINKQIENLPPNIVRSRIALMREYEKERAPLMLQRDAIATQASAMRAATVAGEVHAGPISFIARVSGVTIERAATWSILAFTLCLDPFALYLTALLNKLLLRRSAEKGVTAVVSAAVETPAKAVAPAALAMPAYTFKTSVPSEPVKAAAGAEPPATTDSTLTAVPVVDETPVQRKSYKADVIFRDSPPGGDLKYDIISADARKENLRVQASNTISSLDATVASLTDTYMSKTIIPIHSTLLPTTVPRLGET